MSAMVCVFCPTTAPKLTVDGALRVVEGVRDWRYLGRFLHIPESRLDEINQLSPSENKKALVTYWMENDPFPSWRRLLWALDVMVEKAIADSIRHYAEPLTGSQHSLYYPGQYHTHCYIILMILSGECLSHIPDLEAILE